MMMTAKRLILLLLPTVVATRLERATRLQDTVDEEAMLGRKLSKGSKSKGPNSSKGDGPSGPRCMSFNLAAVFVNGTENAVGAVAEGLLSSSVAEFVPAGTMNLSFTRPPDCISSVARFDDLMGEITLQGCGDAQIPPLSITGGRDGLACASGQAIPTAVGPMAVLFEFTICGPFCVVN